MSLGIKESEEFLKFVGTVAQDVKKSLEDGKFTASDLVNFGDAIMLAPSAFSGISQIPSEISDLDAAELSSLIATGLSMVPSLPPKAGVIAKAAVEFAVAGKKLYDAIKS